MKKIKQSYFVYGILILMILALFVSHFYLHHQVQMELNRAVDITGVWVSSDVESNAQLADKDDGRYVLHFYYDQEFDLIRKNFYEEGDRVQLDPGYDKKYSHIEHGKISKDPHLVNVYLLKGKKQTYTVRIIPQDIPSKKIQKPLPRVDVDLNLQSLVLTVDDVPRKFRHIDTEGVHSFTIYDGLLE